MRALAYVSEDLKHGGTGALGKALPVSLLLFLIGLLISVRYFYINEH